MVKSPNIACTLGWSANFGYGETEHHECQWPATHTLKIPAEFFYPAAKAKICDHHAKVERGNGEKVYRFRKV